MGSGELSADWIRVESGSDVDLQQERDMYSEGERSVV